MVIYLFYLFRPIPTFFGTYIYFASFNLASRFVTHIKITPNSKIKNKVSLQINLEKNSSNFSYIYISVNFENLTVEFHVLYVLNTYIKFRLN